MAPRLVAIVGPTGIGKSALALAMARALNGEIISADSRQVYRLMDIGTAKPTLAEQASVPHHLIDIIDPDVAFSLADYQELAFRAIDTVQRKGKTPFFVGGSGLYVRAVLENWQVPRVPPDTFFREALEDRAAHGEATALFDELKQLNPQAAARLDPHNTRRVIRALELIQSGGVPPAAKGPTLFDSFILGLTTERAALYRRVDTRVDAMIAAGMVDEVKALVRMGFGLELPSMSGIGYRQIGLYLNGQVSLVQAIELIKTESHRFVRQQYNWFKLTDSRIHWYNTDNLAPEKITEAIRRFTGAA